MKRPPEDLSPFPGGDLVSQGLKDLEKHVMSEAALLVLIARENLLNLGFEVRLESQSDEPYEHLLYDAIEQRMPKGAHYEYNSLIQRVVSFTHAMTQYQKNRS